MVQKIKGYGKRTFAALAVYNYRLYFMGQGLSLTGSWIQSVAQTWLALELTHSATMIGFLTAVQFLPVLVLGPLGGVLTDRFDKRRILYVTQSVSLLVSLLMGVLVAGGLIRIWMVFVLAAVSGLAKVVDNPTRQTFIMEMVGRDQLRNAVSLNSIEVNLTRIVGPAVAALLIAKVGLAECFFIDAASFLAVLAGLVMMRAHELQPGERQKKRAGQLREGLRYVWQTPALRDVLLMMAVVGTLSYEFPVVLPVFAKTTFHGDAADYALLTSAMSVGAVIGGLVTASRRRTAVWAVPAAAASFGVCLLITALAPTLWLAAALMIGVGFASISFMSLGNSILQLQSAPPMRGRVMALWSVAFMGSTPVGGPIIGWISEHFSPRWGLAVGGVAALAAAAIGLWAGRHRNQPSQIAGQPAEAGPAQV